MIQPLKYGNTNCYYIKGKKLRQDAKEANIPEHILGKPLTEKTTLDSIKRIQAQTEEELQRGRKIIEEQHSRVFTYEWLSKKDPKNAIMGIFCSCCGTITNSAYGNRIARVSVTAADVQNLVIRDSKNNIISKGTVYVNKSEGYAVINDFELNEKYKKHEIPGKAGRYNVEETNKEEKERDQIFETFQRGLRAFIEEYNEQNPNTPLRQINVGMNYNRLKKQVERFKKATSNLAVPEEYRFEDAAIEQYILYQREEGQIENEGDDR